MAKIIELKGIQQAQANMARIIRKWRKDANAAVEVGYTASYAIYVHENMNPVNLPTGSGAQAIAIAQGAGLKGRARKQLLEASGAKPRQSKLGYYWGPSFYGPKFLEGPARYLAGELGVIIIKAVGAGQTVAEALLLAGLRLQRESQKLVPVEYGNLINSAFTAYASIVELQ
jgi:hypothetical protein